MSTAWSPNDNGNPQQNNPAGQPAWGQQPMQMQQQYDQNGMPVNMYSQQINVKSKSKVVAALLFFFLGAMGAGNFYLNQNSRGFIKLGLFLLAVPFAFFLIGEMIWAALALWAFVEFIMVLTGSGGYDRDARGVPLS
ncbi:NINE protein [Corynebacterium genitalium]|nr:NINE protein [Corynebacterium genitalium]